jgi:PPOX class probable F420-dependent enzyme
VKAPLRELPDWATQMLVQAPVAHLGLLDEHDRPRVLPVTFVLHDDFLWSAVDEKPKQVSAGELARVRFLQRRPEAALTVDHYDTDWDMLAWVQTLGRVEILDKAAEPGAVAALCEKYEQYSRRAPGGPLLRLEPERALCWRANQGPTR